MTASTLFRMSVAVLLIAFGLGTALASLPMAAEPARLFLDVVIWPLDGRQSLASTEARLLCAILGGVLTGWGVTLLMLFRTDGPLTERELGAAGRTGILAWFAVDSLGSVLAGVPLNAVVNGVIAACLLVPLSRFGTARWRS